MNLSFVRISSKDFKPTSCPSSSYFFSSASTVCESSPSSNIVPESTAIVVTSSSTPSSMAKYVTSSSSSSLCNACRPEATRPSINIGTAHLIGSHSHSQNTRKTQIFLIL